MDIEKLRYWFLEKRRPFPWREAISAYGVLVSEMMLQQTQASRVVVFYERFMQRFPTFLALANASIDSVYKEWEGLGYYSRARALHEIARTVVATCRGVLPDTKEKLLALKGIGPYTVHALLAFAFRQNVAAVDANVVRVIARLFAIESEVTKQKTKQNIQNYANALIPSEKGYEIAEALIELGALVCTPKKPLCAQCPLRATCRSYLTNRVDAIPVKGTRVQYEKLHRDVAVIAAGNEILLRQCPEGKIMAGLYEFPFFESTPKGRSCELVQNDVKKYFSLETAFETAFKRVAQSFTRYRVLLFPYLFHAEKKEVVGYKWFPVEEATNLPFSSGHKRVFEIIRTFVTGYSDLVT